MCRVPSPLGDASVFHFIPAHLINMQTAHLSAAISSNLALLLLGLHSSQHQCLSPCKPVLKTPYAQHLTVMPNAPCSTPCTPVLNSKHDAKCIMLSTLHTSAQCRTMMPNTVMAKARTEDIHDKYTPFFLGSLVVWLSEVDVKASLQGLR
jgi:hypothetical protein